MAGKPRRAVANTELDSFEFEEGGRTFTCSAEPAHAGRPEGWWWFRVIPDLRDQRYAPFRMAADDTRANVQARIVAYHDALLARRAQPSTSGPWGRRPGAPTSEPAQPAQPAQPVE